jgi:hypothetical protein
MVVVSDDANPEATAAGDDPTDAAALARHARALAEGVEAALAPWVERVVTDRWLAWRGEPPPPEVREQARVAGDAARAEVAPRVRRLLEADVDRQPTGPLDIVRSAVVHPTRVLADAGMPPVVRDEHAERLFPHDVYDLSPGAFGDLDADLHEPGLVWGAAKAHVVLARRRREGRRQTRRRRSGPGSA